MAVSGTNTFNQVRNEIIKKAYRRIGVLSQENELTAFQIQEGSDILNIMIKAWLSQPIALWKQSYGTLFLDPDVYEYILNGSNANATEDYDETTLSADVNSGATSITVEDTTGFVVGYFIGIMQDDNSLHWTTITNIVGSTITINNALTEDAAEGNEVIVYETKINRPENIINAQCKISSTLEIPMALVSRDTYDAINIKTLNTIPTQLYYNKQLSFGEIKIFGNPFNSSYRINFTFQKQYFDMTNATTDFDFPNEWFEPLYLNLAVRLIGFNAIKDQEFIANLKQEAAEALALVKGFDDENTSFWSVPAGDNNRGLSQ